MLYLWPERSDQSCAPMTLHDFSALQMMVATFHNHLYSSTTFDEKLVTSIMFCILRWCMNIPLEDLTRTDDDANCLLGKVLKV